MSPYTPQPGTFPFRAIEHLKTLPEGTELTTAELCDALGRDDPNGFASCMLSATRYGFVKQSRRRGSRLAFWSLGDGTPAVAEPRDPDDDHDHETGDQVLAACNAPSSVWEFAGGSSQQVDPVGAEEMADAVAASFPTATADDMRAFDTPPVFVDSTDDETFACALWSDGRLQLQQVGEEMLLSVEQTRTLVAYLERMAVAA